MLTSAQNTRNNGIMYILIIYYTYTQYGWEGMGCQWLAGFVYERGEIMIGSSDNSGGVVVGALACGTEYSEFKSRFML